MFDWAQVRLWRTNYNDRVLSQEIFTTTSSSLKSGLDALSKRYCFPDLCLSYQYVAGLLQQTTLYSANPPNLVDNDN